MITRRESIPLLLEACPTFCEWFDGMGEFYTDKAWKELSRQMLSLFFTNFAWHLLSLHQNQKTESFAPVSCVIERLVCDGDPEVRNVSVRDLLESIQCIWNYNKVDPNLFFTFLGPKSARFWQELRNRSGAAT